MKKAHSVQVYLLIFLMLMAGHIEAAPLIIDAFGTPSGTSLSIYAYQGGGAAYSGNTAADAVGGFRQMFIQVNNAIQPFDYAQVDLSGGSLSYANSANVGGKVGLIYGYGASLGLDLTDHFASGDYFQFTFAAPTTTSISLLFQLISSNSDKAIGSTTIPTGSTAFSLPLSAFAIFGNFNPADISEIFPTLTVPTNTGGTYQLDSIALIPEPSPRFLLGMAAVLFMLTKFTRVPLFSQRQLATTRSESTAQKAP